MTMPLGSVAPAGGGFGQNGTAQQVHDQVKLRVVSGGSMLSAKDAAAEAAVTTAETAQAVQPTPDSAAAVKVDIDPDRPVSDGISYPITGPDEFARKVGEHTSYELQSAREEAADEAREAAAAAARAERLEEAAAVEARIVEADNAVPVEDAGVEVEAPDMPASNEDTAEEAVAGGSDPETPGFG